MNCLNHPSVPATAYCQNCGKPMCAECVRSVGGVVYCEQCLAARLGIPVAGQPAPGAAPGAIPIPMLQESHPNPGLAAILGFIPGVGAMYNGQFVKALAHVLIFAVFVSLSDHSGIFGLFIAAWVFYQVFDAFQTAKARRDGLPLPNPFGLNDLGIRLGLTPAHPGVPPGMPPGVQPGGAQAGAASGAQPGAYPGAAYVPPAYGAPAGTAAPFTADPQGSPAAASGAYYTPPYTATAIPESIPEPVMGGRREPIGAIVLIGIGLFFLFHTLGVFRGEWVDRSWPLILVGIGGWLLYRRTREAAGGGQ